jgi:hypothetical protein
MKRKIILCILCAAVTGLCMAVILSSCRGGEGESTSADSSAVTDEPTETADGADTDENGGSETVSETVTPAESETDEPLYAESGYSADEAGAKMEDVLLAADYGAVGDGVTDDGPAISEAVRAAAEKQATLRFESGKTYYIGSATNTASVFRSAFAMDGASGVTIDGQGATFRVKPGLSYFALTDCSGIRLENCVFDMSVSVYLVGRVESADGKNVMFSVNEEPNLSDYDYTSVNGFAIRYNEGIQERPHQFLGRMVRTGERQVKVTFKNDPGYQKGDLVFLPNPGIGHVYSEAIYINGSTGAMVFENITIRQAPSFIMSIKGNDAEIYFENVDMMPDQNDGREIHMVSWRDGYHCKDNRLPIHWNECDVGVLFDDVFNISNTMGYITEVADGSSFTVVNYEYWQQGLRVSPFYRVGDVIDVYDLSTGTFSGTGTVRRVDANADGSSTLTLEYGESLSHVKAGFVVANRETGAPGSTITNSRFTGTFRFLRNLRVENCSFETLQTWIMVEGSVEGPLPGNIDFINCTFDGNIQIDALNRNTGRKLRGIGKSIHDIGFWGCTFVGDTQITSDLKCDYTVSDQWTEQDLYTVKNRKSATIDIVAAEPSEDDFARTVTYDWTRHTMQTGGAARRLVSGITDALTKEALENGDGFSGRVLEMNDAVLTLDGLSSFAFLFDSGKMYTMQVTVYATADGSASLVAVKDGAAVRTIDTRAVRAGKTTTLYFSWTASADFNGMQLCFADGGQVYVGHIDICVASNSNPSRAQLENGYTFIWSDEVTIGNSTAMAVSEIQDEAVRNAVESAASGFTSGTVLHLDSELGDFTGLTESRFYTTGQTYHLSIDAYIASPMISKNGTVIYLLAIDSTPGNRVVAEGLLTGEGYWHFETDWTVGDTGEASLRFYISNQPTSYPDVYIGDFTVTAAKSYKPTRFETVSDFAYPTAEELKDGYTFGFTDDTLLDTGVDAYAQLSSMDESIAEKLRALGFGDRVYYCNENFMLESVSPAMEGSKKYEITLRVYDVRGNLATSGERGAFVLLHMTGGTQNSAEVHYKVEKDPEDSRLLTLTFTGTFPAGTDGLLLYGLTSVEFIIGYISVSF